MISAVKHSIHHTFRIHTTNDNVEYQLIPIHSDDEKIMQSSSFKLAQITLIS